MDRGGRTAHQGGPRHSAEEYELIDYADIQTRKEGETKEFLKQAKRSKKRRWLDEQDEMRFSHSIQFNAVPDWSSHYIAYSNIKKLYDPWLQPCILT